MKMAFRFEGGAELAAEFDALPKRWSITAKKDALMDGGELIRKRAASGAPRKPGQPDMADHIIIAPVRATAAREAAVGIGPDSRAFFYDYFQEFGTSRHRAQPFYRPALDTTIPAALGVIGQALWTALAAKGISRSGSAPSGLGGGLI